MNMTRHWQVFAVGISLLMAFPTLAAPFIAVNQVGYRPDAPKRAILANVTGSNSVAIKLIRETDQQPVLTLDSGAPHRDSESGLSVREITFSEYREPGMYRLQSGNTRSATFRIADDVYMGALRKLIRSFFLQRCGVPLHDAESGLKHAACHLHDAKRARDDVDGKAGSSFDATGGWHDAGDFGKYISTTAIAVGRLLDIYERYPTFRGDGWLDIPESGNGNPDLLDEVAVALDWMLKMQRSDGAVYRKLSGAKWPPLVVPEADQQTRYAYGPASSDTAKFAAVMAMGARIWQPTDGQRAARYRYAAERAWSRLTTLGEQTVDWSKEDDTGSGKYLHSEIDSEVTLTTDTDDRLWAAAELWLTTGRQTFRQYVETNLAEVPYTLFEWKNPAPLGIVNAMREARRRGAGSTFARQLEDKVTVRARELTAIAKRSTWRLANQRYVWGSNKMAAEDGITLAIAASLGMPSAALAQAQADFVLGINPFNQTFVTDLGERPVLNVHHIFGRAVGSDIPGLMVGGPNTSAQAGIAPKGLGLMSYADDARSYATNEYAVDYNAALIGLLAELHHHPFKP